MIAFRHVGVEQQGRRMLADVNFELERGDFAFLLGPTGSGKSTVLQLIFFERRPTKGVVQVGEFDSETIRDRDIPALRRSVSMVFQNHRLLQDRTVYENVAFAMEVTERAALDSLTARLEADREQLKKAKTRQKAVTLDLGRKERDIVRIRGELRKLARRQRNLTRRLGTARRELVRVDARKKTRETDISRRMREMYKLGRRGTLRILFSAGSFTEAFRRLRYLSRVGAQDRRDFEAIQYDRKRISGVLRLQAVRHERQKALLSVKSKAEDRLAVHVRRREAELKRLRMDADAGAEAVRRTKAAMEASSERIRQIIQETGSWRQHTALPPFDFSSHLGRLPRPAPGGVVEHFGRHQDPDLKTWTFHRGINIAAPAGTEVRAVAPGRVALVDWFPGYGQFVLLHHPGGFYTLYGHLSEVYVTPEHPVVQAAVLGTVGSTGRIDGIPQLHFEIMRGEEPINPALWLAKSQ